MYISEHYHPFLWVQWKSLIYQLNTYLHFLTEQSCCIASRVRQLNRKYILYHCKYFYHDILKQNKTTSIQPCYIFILHLELQTVLQTKNNSQIKYNPWLDLGITDLRKAFWKQDSFMDLFCSATFTYSPSSPLLSAVPAHFWLLTNCFGRNRISYLLLSSDNAMFDWSFWLLWWDTGTGSFPAVVFILDRSSPETTN
jgi:hypothetical protein